MFCGKCGSLIKNGNLFCTQCGSKVETIGDSVIIAIKDFHVMEKRGVVVTGVLEIAHIKLGQACVHFNTASQIETAVTITGIEMHGKVHNSACCGDAVGLLIRKNSTQPGYQIDPRILHPEATAFNVQPGDFLLLDQ